MREHERWLDDGSPGSGAEVVIGLADWPDIDLGSVSPVRLLGLVSAVDSATADDQESLGAVAACEQVLRYVTALQLRFVHRAVTAGGPQEDPDSRFDVVSGIELVAAELAPLFGLSKRSAQNKVSQAQALVADLPKLVERIEAGSLDLYRARAVDDVMREVLHPESDAEIWATVQEAIAERAPGCSNRWLRELTRRAIHNADPQAASRRAQEAGDERRVALTPRPDAMCDITAILPADQAQLVDTVLDALADGCRDHTRTAGTPDPRTHAQRRADAFVALFRSISTANPLPLFPKATPTPVTPRFGAAGTGDAAGAGAGDGAGARQGVEAGADDQAHFGGRWEALSAPVNGVIGWWHPPTLPRQQGRRPQITVTLPLSTLTGLDDHAADLAGYGPIPADLARAIAAEAAHYRVVPIPDDPVPPPSTTGRRTNAPSASASRASTTTRPPSPPGVRVAKPVHGAGDQDTCPNTDRGYRPTQALTDQVMAFHRQCRHPGCSLRAQRCDLDHVTEYPDGPTCACNLMPLCRFHHRLKTHGGWKARFTTPNEPHPRGTVEWTSRHGAKYHDIPTLYSLDLGSETVRQQYV
jgi:hypothetical protein